MEGATAAGSKALQDKAHFLSPFPVLKKRNWVCGINGAAVTLGTNTLKTEKKKQRGKKIFLQNRKWRSY